MRGQLKKESEALYFGSLYDLLLSNLKKQTLTILLTMRYHQGYWWQVSRTRRSTKSGKRRQLQAAENADKMLAAEEDVKKANEMIQAPQRLRPVRQAFCWGQVSGRVQRGS